MCLQRFPENPLISPGDVTPSRRDMEVVCVFNCACARLGGQVVLLLRVAERPVCEPDELIAPMLDPDRPGELCCLRVRRGDPDLQEIDSRMFRYRGRLYLTSISHLRLARSDDGRRFTVEPRPAMTPADPIEEYGLEDPRITPLAGGFAVNYTAVSRHGIATALAWTRDLDSFERRGVILPPDNRDVTIFPEIIGGRYVCHHRPMAGLFGACDIWFAESPDLLHWGGHRRVCGPRPGEWDSGRVGGGAVPFNTPRGWLSIYHGADQRQRYGLGLLLTDADAPWKVLARSRRPILEPEADYERRGFFGEVVFTCGALLEPDGRVVVYYGAADRQICAAEATIDELLATLI